MIDHTTDRKQLQKSILMAYTVVCEIALCVKFLFLISYNLSTQNDSPFQIFCLIDILILFRKSNSNLSIKLMYALVCTCKSRIYSNTIYSFSFTYSSSSSFRSSPPLLPSVLGVPRSSSPYCWPFPSLAFSPNDEWITWMERHLNYWGRAEEWLSGVQCFQRLQCANERDMHVAKSGAAVD